MPKPSMALSTTMEACHQVIQELHQLVQDLLVRLEKLEVENRQ